MGTGRETRLDHAGEVLKGRDSGEVPWSLWERCRSGLGVMKKKWHSDHSSPGPRAGGKAQMMAKERPVGGKAWPRTPKTIQGAMGDSLSCQVEQCETLGQQTKLDFHRVLHVETSRSLCSISLSSASGTLFNVSTAAQDGTSESTSPSAGRKMPCRYRHLTH